MTCHARSTKELCVASCSSTMPLSRRGMLDGHEYKCYYCFTTTVPAITIIHACRGKRTRFRDHAESMLRCCYELLSAVFLVTIQ